PDEAIHAENDLAWTHVEIRSGSERALWPLEVLQPAETPCRTDGAVEIAIEPEARHAGALLASAAGDFGLEGVLSGQGGLLVWQDAAHHAEVMRHPWIDVEVRFEAATVDTGRSIWTTIGRGRLPADRIRLRLDRRGDRLAAWAAAEGDPWGD